MQRQESRLVASQPPRAWSLCGYALNAFHDDERKRREREGITDEKSWLEHCDHARVAFRYGGLSTYCGNQAVILTIHQGGDLFPYCAGCFVRDLAVNDGASVFIRLPGFTQADANKIATGFPDFHWYPKSMSFEQWERAVETWRRATEVVHA